MQESGVIVGEFTDDPYSLLGSRDRVPDAACLHVALAQISQCHSKVGHERTVVCSESTEQLNSLFRNGHRLLDPADITLISVRQGY